MLRASLIFRPRAWLVTWLMLLPLWLAQTGIVELVEDDLAALVSDAGGGACEERCPGEAPDGDECPPQCDYCMCCPRAVPAIVAGAALAGTSLVATAELPLAPDRLSVGIAQRVFRPPRTALVC